MRLGVGLAVRAHHVVPRLVVDHGVYPVAKLDAVDLAAVENVASGSAVDFARGDVGVEIGSALLDLLDAGEHEFAPVAAAAHSREEELLAGTQSSTSTSQESASLVTSVLSHCVQRIGDISPISEEVARNLLIADRLALLLRLREVTFGDQVQATISCPWPDCGHKMDADFSLYDLVVKESEDKGPTYRMTLSPEAALVDDDGW